MDNEVLIRSSLDGTMQPSLYYRSPSAGKRPLLVGLHTWSNNRFNQVSTMVPWAERYDFNLILPEFRGPNLDTNPHCAMACASEYAMRDIRDAVDWAVGAGNADAGHVLLYGASGGGHMALMMAGCCPEYFEAIAAFVPITDLKKWAGQNASYRPHILACCGGDEEEMFRRSPISRIDRIARANVKIFHGKYDRSVPVTHSIDLFNRIMAEYPESRVFLDVFDGGHETDEHEALYWLISQYEKKSAGGNGAKVTG